MTSDTIDIEAEDGGRIAYEPNETVSDVWRRELQSVGVSSEMADRITNMTFGDPELTLGEPGVDDVYRIVEEILDQYDLEKPTEDGTDPEVVKRRLLAVLNAGLEGRLLGPSPAPKSVALANESMAPPTQPMGASVSPSSTREWRRPYADISKGPSGVVAVDDEDNVSAELLEQILTTLVDVADGHDSSSTRAAAIDSLTSTIVDTDNPSHNAEVVNHLAEWAYVKDETVSVAAVEALERIFAAQILQSGEPSVHGSAKRLISEMYDTENQDAEETMDVSNLTAEPGSPLDDPDEDNSGI